MDGDSDEERCRRIRNQVRNALSDDEFAEYEGILRPRTRKDEEDEAKAQELFRRYPPNSSGYFSPRIRRHLEFVINTSMPEDNSTRSPATTPSPSTRTETSTHKKQFRKVITSYSGTHRMHHHSNDNDDDDDDDDDEGMLQILGFHNRED